jgi:NAD(P)-dependent dehydrogenase (short-subunit alcohol dehydrogenase family)
MLSNKLALVTGSASGIGLEVVKLFAKEGATIIAVDLDEKVKAIPSQLESPKDHSHKHSAHKIDVSKSDQVKELFQNIKQDYPKQQCNVIVNCVIFIHYILN